MASAVLGERVVLGHRIQVEGVCRGVVPPEAATRAADVQSAGA